MQPRPCRVRRRRPRHRRRCGRPQSVRLRSWTAGGSATVRVVYAVLCSRTTRRLQICKILATFPLLRVSLTITSDALAKPPTSSRTISSTSTSTALSSPPKIATLAHRLRLRISQSSRKPRHLRSYCIV